jgi:hypothetical protein
MNKKGVLGNIFLAIVLLIISGICFYYWWTTSEPARCVSPSMGEQFLHSALFLFGVMFLMLAVVITYSALRPTTGCFGEPTAEFIKAMEEKNAKDKHKLSNKK